ncbi:hypothetical protein Scep_018832 [Stephania cephalantha]|uniref:Protein TONSOKU n=1 Tax=Stephania cephalantha TaxID=152367 RepID=A0AAP0I9R4_9MAGN
MARDDAELSAAKRAYRQASSVGSSQEEARWANMIGNILKNRGEYVEALKWFRIDYEISVKFLPEKQLLPTCQSLGEVYLRLQEFKQALIYQNDNNNVTPQDTLAHKSLPYDLDPRVMNWDLYMLASRGYFDFERHSKKHLELAKDSQDLVEQQRAMTQLGRTYHEMFLKSDDDHYSVRNAKKYFRSSMKLARSLKESMRPNKSSSFLKEFIDAHNNIGMIEMDLDNLDAAEKILLEGLKICDEEEVIGDDDGRSRLHHNLGREAKGYINLGELHYRLQKYEEALMCYQKAHDVVKSLEDEDALVENIDENIRTIKEAAKVMDDLKNEEQNLKKQIRTTAIAKGTPRERKCLLQKNASLDLLIEKASMIFAWKKGQALAKVNIGGVLDSNGDWSVEANLPAVQISALENMHYSHMIRFDNVEEAKRLQNMIQDLKSSRNTEVNRESLVRECCSETESEEDEDSSRDGARALNSSKKMSESASNRSKRPTVADELMDDTPLISLLDPTKTISYPKACEGEKRRKLIETSPKGISKSVDNQFPLVGRKRVRVVLSDDESDGHNEAEVSKVAIRDESIEDVATSCEFRKSDGSTHLANELQDASLFATREIRSASTPINLEDSTCSFKSGSSKVTSHNGRNLRFRSAAESPNASNFQVSGSKNAEDHVSDNLLENDNHDAFNLRTSDEEYIHHMTFKIEDKIVHVDGSSCMVGDYLSIECLKVEVACMYYLQLSEEKKARGWVQKRLMKLYVDCCKKWHEAPHMKLLKKLYRLEVSEDEVVLSDCELQDVSIAPLLDALQQHKTIAVLDLSHNLLGNETMEKLQQIFLSSGQKYGGLTLDLHCNRLGPTSLFQICECPVLLARLEVLNISGNRLTDACGSYLSAILENCKGLVLLFSCSITSRTIQKVADAIGSESVLAQLHLGHNPITGNALVHLLAKLATLKRFSELSLNGLKLNKPIVDALCQLARSSCLSGLMLGGTSIGADGAQHLVNALSTGPQELLKLDLSYCGLNSQSPATLFTDINLFGSIAELNLSGNSIALEGLNALELLLMNAQCSLRSLVLNKCNLGLSGITKIIQALAENKCLEDLNLAENVYKVLEDNSALHCVSTQETSSKSLQPKLCLSGATQSKSSFDKAEDVQQGMCVMNSECDLRVADSEDEQIEDRPATSSLDDSCTSSCRRNTSSASPFNQSIEDLATAIGLAKHLQMLDISGNGFSAEITESLYTAWSSGLRSGGLSQRHIKEQLIHFSVQGKICCAVPKCCKKD